MSNEQNDVVMRDGNEVVAFTAEAPAAVRNSQGVLGTARNGISGGQLHGAPTGKDIVTVGTTEMTLDQAVDYGFLAKNPDGTYRDLTADESKTQEIEAEAKRTAEQEAAQEEAAEHAISVTDETGEGLTDLVGALEEIGANSAGTVSQFAMNPERLPESIKHLARSKGIDEAAALTHLQAMGQDIYVGIADYVAENGGVGRDQLDEFFDWVKETHSGKLGPAIISTVFMRDARPWLTLAENFLVDKGRGNGEATPERITKHRVGDKIVDTVTVKGLGPMSVAGARKLKLI